MSKVLPPIILYRRLLRAHYKVLKDPSLRFLGDDYVKAEFRRHRQVTNPIQLLHFLSQWTAYLDKLQESNAQVFDSLDEQELDKFNDQQIGQLTELRQAAREMYSNTQTPSTS